MRSKIESNRTPNIKRISEMVSFREIGILSKHGKHENRPISPESRLSCGVGYVCVRLSPTWCHPETHILRGEFWSNRIAVAGETTLIASSRKEK